MTYDWKLYELLERHSLMQASRIEILQIRGIELNQRKTIASTCLESNNWWRWTSCSKVFGPFHLLKTNETSLQGMWFSSFFLSFLDDWIIFYTNAKNYIANRAWNRERGWFFRNQQTSRNVNKAWVTMSTSWVWMVHMILEFDLW